MRPATGRSIDIATPIRILVVDDEPSYLRLIGLVLRRYGYTVLSAASGEEAMDHANQVDIAVVDMMMPEMDGLETIQLLQWHNPQLKVIASSGCAESEFRGELDRLGVEIFLAKPFPVEALMAQVQAMMRSALA
jgi:DNA-binding response OmpR family regulator